MVLILKPQLPCIFPQNFSIKYQSSALFGRTLTLSATCDECIYLLGGEYIFFGQVLRTKMTDKNSKGTEQLRSWADLIYIGFMGIFPPKNITGLSNLFQKNKRIKDSDSFDIHDLGVI